MSVSNGQQANASVFNSAFMSRSAATTSTIAKIDLNNTLPASGPSVVGLQQYIYEMAGSVGYAGSGDANKDIYSATPLPVVVTNGDSRKTAIKKIDDKFRALYANGGHTHTGVDGDAALVSALTLADFNPYEAVYQALDVLTASGSSYNVSTEFTGLFPDGAAAIEGVVTDAPLNRVEIMSKDTQTFIEDAGGQRVYGRLTETTGVWTLTFYTNEAGVETSHTLSSQDITILFRQVFNVKNKPTFSADLGVFESLDLTADVVDASVTQRGLVSTGTQTLSGLKTLNDGAIINTYFALPKVDDTLIASGTISYVPFKKIISAASYNIQGISSGANGKAIIIHNNSSFKQVVKHEDGAATAANRFKLPLANDIDLETDNSIEFIYDSGQSRWVIKSAAGASGGFSVLSDAFTLLDNTSSATSILGVDLTNFSGYIIEFYISRITGNARTGRFIGTALEDGSDFNYAEGPDSDIGDVGVTFTADINAGFLRWLYTTTNTGNNALMTYEIKSIPRP